MGWLTNLHILEFNTSAVISTDKKGGGNTNTDVSLPVEPLSPT